MAKNIVIVEDDPDQRNNYIDAIGKKGYSVRGFSSRPEALAGFDQPYPTSLSSTLFWAMRSMLGSNYAETS